MKDTIKARYDADVATRQPYLDRARFCAALTKPWVCPPEDQNASSRLPEAYQSLGARGVTNLEGKMIVAQFPPGTPWYRLRPAASIRFDQRIDPALLQEMEKRLYLHELIIQATLEASNIEAGTNRQRSTFRSRKRMAASQYLITGDTLEQLTDDYRLKVYRRDQYVTLRDSSGDVLYHIIREHIDPQGLPQAIRSRANLRLEADVKKRMEDLYTEVKWQPLSKSWLIRQEIDGKTVNESEEAVSPYFSTPFELSPGEHYGRGFIELNLGDLRSLNALRERLLDFAAMASKMTPVRDYNSLVREDDLTKATGEPIQARVQNGQVQDVAFLKLDKLADFQVVHLTSEKINQELSRAMLIESEVQPTGERVTARQVQRIAMELDGALGGIYAPVADSQQIPLLQRAIWQLRRDNMLPTMPKGAVEIEALTGIAALSREVDAQKLFGAFQALAALGPQALGRIDMNVAADVLVRHFGIYEPGLIKSAEQMQREQQEQMDQATEAEARKKAIDVAGNVAEQTAIRQ